MKTALAILLVAVFALAIAATAFVVIGREATWRRLAGDPDLGPFDLANPVRSTRPHDALLCSPGLCAGVRTDGALPIYDLPPAALIARLDQAVIADTATIKQRVDDRIDPAALRYVTWTGTMRFPDTNQFLAVALPDGRTGLVAYARAQLGESDLGNNLKRLKRWTGTLTN